MPPKIEYRSFGSFSRDGASPGTIKGKVVTYGESALIGKQFEERFEAGCFGDIQDVIANIQHDRKRPVARQGVDLTLEDSPSVLNATIDLTGTTNGKEARQMVEREILRGLSAEFVCNTDEWNGNQRVIKEAELCGIGIVDKPAYCGSTIDEIRHFAPWYEERQDYHSLLPLVLGQVQIKDQNHERRIQTYLRQNQSIIEKQIQSPTYRNRLVEILNNLVGRRWLYH